MNLFNSQVNPEVGIIISYSQMRELKQSLSSSMKVTQIVNGRSGIHKGHNFGTEPWKLSQSLPDGQKKGCSKSIPDTGVLKTPVLKSYFNGNHKYESLKIIRNLQVHLQVGCLWDSNKCPGLRSGISKRQEKTGVMYPTREGLRECRHKLLEVTIGF